VDPLRAAVVAIIKEELPGLLAEARKERGDYMSTAEAAAHARVAPGTVRRWIRDGHLQGCGAGRAIRVRRGELEALMQAGRAARAVGGGPVPVRQPSPEALAARVVAGMQTRVPRK
jgi:excisionase family DNA binding protein